MTKRKSRHLSVVTKETEEATRRELTKLWDEAEQSWMISDTEMRRRVREVRQELENERDQLEGAPFDLPCDEVPRSLNRPRKEFMADLLPINPMIEGLFRMIDNYAEQHGCQEHLDFNAKLFLLKMEAAETGFKIGLLAGVIFAGCSETKIDQFERGLAFALSSHPGIVKR